MSLFKWFFPGAGGKFDHLSGFLSSSRQYLKFRWVPIITDRTPHMWREVVRPKCFSFNIDFFFRISAFRQVIHLLDKSDPHSTKIILKISLVIYCHNSVLVFFKSPFSINVVLLPKPIA